VRQRLAKSWFRQSGCARRFADDQVALGRVLVGRGQGLVGVGGGGLNPLVVHAGVLVPVEPGHIFNLLQNVHGDNAAIV
jgi:hypothetical protein